MVVKSLFFILGLVVSTASFATMKAADKVSEVETVRYVDVERYMGKWYEIASFFNFFQIGCTATTAEYSLKENGEVKVVNSCNLLSPDGKRISVDGTAWIVDEDTNAKLKVQFFFESRRIPRIAGDYWILKLDDDYQHVLVGNASRKYLWILSRTPNMDPDIYQRYVDEAKEQGFDVSRLRKTKH